MMAPRLLARAARAGDASTTAAAPVLYAGNISSVKGDETCSEARISAGVTTEVRMLRGDDEATPISRAASSASNSSVVSCSLNAQDA